MTGVMDTSPMLNSGLPVFSITDGLQLKANIYAPMICSRHVMQCVFSLLLARHVIKLIFSFINLTWQDCKSSISDRHFCSKI